MIINDSRISTLNIKGRVGKEAEILSLFPEYERVSAALYDFVNSSDPDDKLETKKQANCQWFDVGKYHDIDVTGDTNINMVFLVHKDGVIQHIFRVTLGDMLDILCTDPEFQKDGWTFENIKDCSIKKKQFPSMQVKVKLNVKSFYKKHQNKLETLYVAS